MFPSFIPPEAVEISESAAQEIISQIKREAISTSLDTLPVETAYVKQGRGEPPILLLHGFDSSVLEFRRLLPLLSLGKETWAVDLWGFGFNTRKPAPSTGPKAIKTHLYQFWESQIRQPVVLVGASMGGAAALDFTLNYPHAVTKLVLLDSAGLTGQPFFAKLMFPPLGYLATEFLRNATVRRKISEAAYKNKSLATEDAYRCGALHLSLPHWNQALIAFTKSGGYGSFLSQLGEIKQPTLIIWGDSDEILGTKAAKQFEEGIPNSQLIWIPDCGHVPHLEQPDITARKILDWLPTS